MYDTGKHGAAVNARDELAAGRRDWRNPFIVWRPDGRLAPAHRCACAVKAGAH